MSLPQQILDPHSLTREQRGGALAPLLSKYSMESQEDADLQLERSTPASRASKHLIPFPHGPFETRPRNELLSIVGCSYVDSCSLTRSFHQRHHPLWITDNTNEGLWKPRIAFLSSSQLDTLSPTLTAPLRVRDCATPDPSALHPFCSGAAPHNGCSAPQQVQRHATGAALRNTDAFRATCAPRDGEYATMTTPEHSMSGAGAIASDLSISPGILSTGTRPTGDRGIVTAAAQHPVHRHATNRCYLEQLLPHSKLVSQCHNHPSVTRPSGTTRLHPAVAASST